MVRLSAIIISLFLIFSFQAQAKNPPPGTGTSDIPANILIMLDNSGSMSARLYNQLKFIILLDIATDSSGNVYVLEYYNNRIKVFNSSGAYLRSFGRYMDMDVINGRYARQFTIYNDEIYIADTYGIDRNKNELNRSMYSKEDTAFQLSSCNSSKQYICVVGYQLEWSWKYISAVHEIECIAAKLLIQVIYA